MCPTLKYPVIPLIRILEETSLLNFHYATVKTSTCLLLSLQCALSQTREDLNCVPNTYKARNKAYFKVYMFEHTKKVVHLKMRPSRKPLEAENFLQELNSISSYIIKLLKSLLITPIWPWYLVLTKDVISPLSTHYKHTSNIAEGASGFKRHLLWNDRLRHVMSWSDTFSFLLLVFTIIISISIVRFSYSAKQTIFLLIIWLN